LLAYFGSKLVLEIILHRWHITVRQPTFCNIISKMKLIYRKHAIIRVFESDISDEDICEILSVGETIACYPDNSPYPSQLLLGWIDNFRRKRSWNALSANTATHTRALPA
jgi:hypothetical protein